MVSEIKLFIEDHVKKIKDLSKKQRIAYWNSQTTGEDKYYKETEELSKKLQEIYNNKQDFEKVRKWNESEIKDPLLKRQIKILYDSFLSCQGNLKLIHELTEKESKIDQKFNKFRAKIGGKELTDNEIKDILQKEKDSVKLKEAWEASKKQGELVEKELLEIIRLRNKLAKGLGFVNYYQMALEIQEQSKDGIIGLFNELDKLTGKPFARVKNEMDKFLAKRYGISEEDLRPWHYQELFFQQGPEIYDVDMDRYFDKDVIESARTFYQGIGLLVDDVLERSDLYEKKGKCQHAFCIDLDKEGDVRILQNVKNNEYWMGTTLHELGHASYCKNINRKLPYLLIDEAHTFTTEAVAMLFGRLTNTVSFIKKYGKADKKLDQISGILVKKTQLSQLVFSRWVQVMVNFERRLYENPEQDLNKMWWNLTKKYQLINFSRDKPDWAAKIHLVTAPVYYHNYMLGELLASQLHHFIVKNILKQDSLNYFDYSGNKKIGEFLKKNVFSPGAVKKWDEFIEDAVGENLTPKYFAEQFVGN